MLKVALGWWLWALGQDNVEPRPWQTCESPLVHLSVDAAGSPVHCVAVLFIGGKCSYADGSPARHFMEQLRKKSDNRNMSLEILAIAFGLSAFAANVHGRKVVVF